MHKYNVYLLPLFISLFIHLFFDHTLESFDSFGVERKEEMITVVS